MLMIKSPKYCQQRSMISTLMVVISIVLLPLKDSSGSEVNGQQKQDYRAGWHFRSGLPEGAKRTITEQVADFEMVRSRKAVKQPKQDFSAG